MNRIEMRSVDLMGNGLIGEQELGEQEELHVLKKKNFRLSRLVIGLSALILALMCLLATIMTIRAKPTKGAEMDKTAGAAATAVLELPEIKDKDKWQLILVNREIPLPKDFTVDLVSLGGFRVDIRISDPITEILAAAAEDGIGLTVCSGYRSVSQQREIYDNKKQGYINLGYNEQASEVNTLQYVLPPGASEHHTGMAVDFLTEGRGLLDESFADTPAYKWLHEHAAEYGFIERYPEGKSEFTGVLWEPWHYRYVGASNAEAIETYGLCLEEYLELIYS